MNEPEMELFQKYQDKEKDINQLNECEIFVRGFRLGARIMLEVMSDDNKQIGIIED